MRIEHDSSKRKNSHIEELKKYTTIMLSDEEVAYLQARAKETGVPYETLRDLYLIERARNGKPLK